MSKFVDKKFFTFMKNHITIIIVNSNNLFQDFKSYKSN